MDQLGYMRSNPDFMTTVWRRLPCRCVLTHRYIDLLVPGKPTSLAVHAEVLQFWLDDRTKWHKCELVGPDNPAGQIRHADRLQNNPEVGKENAS